MIKNTTEGYKVLITQTKDSCKQILSEENSVDRVFGPMFEFIKDKVNTEYASKVVDYYTNKEGYVECAYGPYHFSEYFSTFLESVNQVVYFIGSISGFM